MMYKNMHYARPLEIGLFQKKNWEESGYKCFAIVDDKEIVRQVVEKHAQTWLNKQVPMFAVLWFFDAGMSRKEYSNLFSNIELIEEREDLLIYEIQNENELKLFIEIWGEIDHLEFVFPKKREAFLASILEKEFSTFNRYRKNFLERVLKTVAIISDSGDGGEAQFVLQDNLECAEKVRHGI